MRAMLQVQGPRVALVVARSAVLVARAPLLFFAVVVVVVIVEEGEARELGDEHVPRRAPRREPLRRLHGTDEGGVEVHVGGVQVDVRVEERLDEVDVARGGGDVQHMLMRREMAIALSALPALSALEERETTELFSCAQGAQGRQCR